LRRRGCLSRRGGRCPGSVFAKSRKDAFPDSWRWRRRLLTRSVSGPRDSDHLSQCRYFCLALRAVLDVCTSHGVDGFAERESRKLRLREDVRIPR
jgi:hypothetical protein